LKLLHQSAVTVANKVLRKAGGMLSGNNGKHRGSVRTRSARIEREARVDLRFWAILD
jgi:hypothetical protein